MRPTLCRAHGCLLFIVVINFDAFWVINSYTTGLSPLTMSYILDLKVKSIYGGKIESGEIGLRVSQTGAVLPCGASTRWTNAK